MVTMIPVTKRMTLIFFMMYCINKAVQLSRKGMIILKKFNRQRYKFENLKVCEFENGLRNFQIFKL